MPHPEEPRPIPENVNVYELEGNMIPSEQWDDPRIPTWMRDEARLASAEGIPTGLAYDPEHGWFCLMAGQGPMIAFWEHGERPVRKPPPPYMRDDVHGVFELEWDDLDD